MALTSGTRLGQYEILESIGAGGQGEVYKAKDTRLERTVAIKVLPEHLAHDPERRERLEREAKAISRLNHPHICTLHDLGAQDGIDFLVMEYLEGETLADRLLRGPLTLEQARRYAAQMADALDLAHRQGVVHRDLKPGNVMLTKPGIKLMDFGLAKVMGAPVAPDVLDSVAATAVKPLTQEGALLGTVPYMAPEQLEGKAVDARSDIFAFGAVVYEMLTARRAFTGDSQASVIAAIMQGEPERLRELVPATPRLFDTVVAKALAKTPEDRWQSMHDIRIVLDALDVGPSETVTAPPSGRNLGRLAWAGAVIAAFALAWVVRTDSSEEVVRMTINLPENQALIGGQVSPFSVSRDGSMLAISTRPNEGGSATLFTRALDDFEFLSAIEDVGSVQQPVFSPDGRYLLIDNLNRLRLDVADLATGTVTEICRTPSIPRGMDWLSDDTIVFGTSTTGLWTVSAHGGEPKPLTALQPGELSHQRPRALPDGRGILFSVERVGTHLVAVTTLDRTGVEILFDGFSPAYVPSGHIVYGAAFSSAELFAIPFELDTLQTNGASVQVVDDAYVQNAFPYFYMGADGTLVYAASPPALQTVVWVHRDGEVDVVAELDRSYHTLRLSPDGKAFAADGAGGSLVDLWAHDLVRGTRIRVGSDPYNLLLPRWTPDGASLAYGNTRGELLLKAADGTGDVEVLVAGDGAQQWPLSWSADGTLVFARLVEGQWDIWTRSSDGVLASLFATSANERAAAISPSGRFIAYQSDESGLEEIYVQPLKGAGSRILISSAGGKAPVWARNGQELFYRQQSAMMVVTVENGAFGKPEMLFDGPFLVDNAGHPSYDVGLDGERFLMIRISQESMRQLKVVLNFDEELKQRVPR